MQNELIIFQELTILKKEKTHIASENREKKKL